MSHELSALEARVIGALIEKEITTPDQYPLSLNALLAACNQKTNREPILDLTSSVVQQTLDSLIKAHLVSDRGGYGGRVTKFKQRFCNTEFSGLKFTAQELGIVCVLLLRGAQTPGELRAHTQRLCEFADTLAVEAALDTLMIRSDGPFVARLARAVGARESRYLHLFSGHVESVAASAVITSAPRGESLAERVTVLENTVGALREELDKLKLALGDA